MVFELLTKDRLRGGINKTHEDTTLQTRSIYLTQKSEKQMKGHRNENAIY